MTREQIKERLKEAGFAYDMKIMYTTCMHKAEINVQLEDMFLGVWGNKAYFEAYPADVIKITFTDIAVSFITKKSITEIFY